MTAREEAQSHYERYLAGEFSHTEHYIWLAEFIGLTDNDIPVPAERIAQSTEGFYNDIPIYIWDREHGRVQNMAFAKGIPWSLANTVCCLKALARRRQENSKN